MRYTALLAFILSAYVSAGADSFNDLLIQSAYIHSPIKTDESLSLDAEAAKKTVLRSIELPGEWKAAGDAAGGYSDSIFTLIADFNTGDRRAKGPDNDPDYALYGHALARLELGGMDLNDYNRLCIEIEPQCPGMRIVNINLSFNNRNLPDNSHNAPTGAHLIHLKNYQRNRCYLEIADLQRDCMNDICLSVSINGRDLPSQGKACYTIHSVRAEKIEHPEKVSGWLPDPTQIIYSTSGYCTEGYKSAIVDSSFSGMEFRLMQQPGRRVVFKGNVALSETSIGRFGLIDFSKLNEAGQYLLSCGDLPEVEITLAGNDMWDNTGWKLLNFIFCMRCGYAVPGVHSRCHTDLFSLHNGQRRPFCGGWHDAGDLSQQTLQTADVTHALLELYSNKRLSNPSLAARLREEALWGLNFVLRNRLGGGWHASSMGLLLWQDGIVGSHDDIESVRIQNCAFDNFLYAAYEAYAARILSLDNNDPELCSYLRQVAVEDYDFASAQFAESGYGGWISPYEHSYNTSESQWEATASWAASQLYLLTGHERYADEARSHAGYVMACQQLEPLGKNAPYGFFFRNPDRRSVVHYIHQSREQLYMLALTALCESQASHPDCRLWRNSVQAYGNYLKGLMQYTAPYGMIPAGIYHRDEHLDTEAFYALHLFPPADAAERYRRQLEQGVQVAEGWVVKRFPVWFNIFNGNLAVHCSMGKAAALCARCLDDSELMQIAREQLYWTVGKNPFAQSLIYGEGRRFPSLNNFSSGELVGAIPVGIRSLDDSDEPYWPNINNACYKEVWLTSAGKILSLLSDIQIYPYPPV